MQPVLQHCCKTKGKAIMPDSRSPSAGFYCTCSQGREEEGLAQLAEVDLYRLVLYYTLPLYLHSHGKSTLRRYSQKSAFQSSFSARINQNQINSQTSCFQIYLQGKAMQKHRLSKYIKKKQKKQTIKPNIQLKI